MVRTAFLQRLSILGLALTITAPAMASTQLTGAGSTFIYPFFSRAFYEYNKKHGDVAINYQSIGSGGGIQQFTEKTVDFGASDVPMNADELKRAGDPVIQIPVALGGITLAYNIPGVSNGLHLTRQLLVDIFLGKITKWNDRRIIKLNASSHLPDLPIVVVHRSDGSGTTYIFTDFLSSVSGEWKSKVGTAKSVQWPAQNSVGAKGNEGAAGQIRNSPGSIGYVELAYAMENHMNTTALLNRSNQWVNCSTETVRAAAATRPNVNARNFSIVDSVGKRSYPIAGYTWAMVYEQPKDRSRGRQVHDVLDWVVNGDAQRYASQLRYVSLPEGVQRSAKAALKRMRV
ncbi:MAG: phosphate ABC transporter substrate-binding protein PstS [Candidatus Eremiobacteraeota bacterium]|nr:phosphate ABC transporter substrate-binding protein PstS [Candidatus Eremiobacteraeota bacterium]